MSFTVHACEQGTDEWCRLRLGRATGSRAADILAMLKKGEAAARRNYRVDLVLERLTGAVQDADFKSVYMLRGTEREADALAQYEAQTGRLVRRTGFLAHDTLQAGVSLDGDVEDFTGIVEAKCPKPATHLEYLKTKRVPLKYRAQIHHAMWLTGAQWGDFLSWCPEFPIELRVCLVRIDRDEEHMAAYEVALRQFLDEVDIEEAVVCALREAGD